MQLSYVNIILLSEVQLTLLKMQDFFRCRIIHVYFFFLRCTRRDLGKHGCMFIYNTTRYFFPPSSGHIYISAVSGQDAN